MPSLKKLALGSLAAAALLLGQSAFAAKVVEAYYHAYNGSLDFRSFGYTDADGNWVSLEGQKILGARAEVLFTPKQEAELSTFRMAMVVPVSGAQSQYFMVEGSSLIPMGNGRYIAEVTSSMYNGVVLGGRFSIETYSLGADGSASALQGKLSYRSGFHFTVTAP